MPERVRLDELLRESDDPADTLAQLIFSGAWFPPDPRVTDSGEGSR